MHFLSLQSLNLLALSSARTNSESILYSKTILKLQNDAELVLALKPIIMLTILDNDIVAMRIHLNELKTAFDHAMRDGECFERVKKIHMEIKELECQVKVLEWEAPAALRQRNDWPYQNIDQPRPLL